ncbi:uncharacterized protein LOC125186049 [Salvia hispanica]|uniref:uncharacterized protein LOC125186049 n=1 Tax=Salvia hispanica TaxID=49212 RepID=UPI002009B89F|nr:uncharacterized protein LOC125186049 [Salvia hispanica]
MAYTKTIRSVMNMLKTVSVSGNSDYQIKLIQLEIEHINAMNVSSKIANYGFVFKMMRLVHLLLFGLVVILPTVIASKKPNDEFAQFFKNAGPFLFTVLFALLEIYVRMNLFDVHEIQKSIRWTRKVIEFIRLVVEYDRPESKPSTQIQIEILKKRGRALEALKLNEEKEQKWRPCCNLRLVEAYKSATCFFRRDDFHWTDVIPILIPVLLVILICLYVVEFWDIATHQ